MRNHGLEPPPIQRCVDNRGLTSDARLVSSKKVVAIIKFHENLQTMMAALDDEIKHLQQEIEGAEEQVHRIELSKPIADKPPAAPAPSGSGQPTGSATIGFPNAKRSWFAAAISWLVPTCPSLYRRT
jgi:hypothetical protein